MRLERLSAQHLDAILEFETVNRDYFVLLRNGFSLVGETTVDGCPARLFALDLTL